MRTSSSYSDYQPLGHIGRVPIHLTTILAIFYIVGMIVTMMLLSAGVPLGGFLLSADTFFQRGWLWQPFTCTFINHADFFFLMGVLFFYSAGIEVERYLGRGRFSKLLILTLTIPVLILGAWALLGVYGDYGGLGNVTIVMFIAFATLYPNLEYFGWVSLKYVVFACWAVACLAYFPRHDWVGLSILLGESALAFGFVRFLQRGGSVEFSEFFGKLNPFKRRPNLRVLPSASVYGRDELNFEEDDDLEAINPLLDKIAKSGMASLTRNELARLESAREALLKKDRR